MRLRIYLVMLAFLLLSLIAAVPKAQSGGLLEKPFQGKLYRKASSVVEPSSTSYSFIVTAVVPPHRLVVMDNDMKISQVVSNTYEEIPPTFVNSSLTGDQLKDCQVCQKEYEEILPSLDFSEIGEVYKVK